jgi:hypothetical protein
VFARTCAVIQSRLPSGGGGLARVFPDSAGVEGARRYCTVGASSRVVANCNAERCHWGRWRHLLS